MSGIRATVREGRDRMRATLLGWLPEDLEGVRVLDAGCGTGAAALVLAGRGAEVVAVDLSPSLIGVAEHRAADQPEASRISFRVGDMLDPRLGEFDFVVAMDALIHYPAAEQVEALARLGERTRSALLTTFAPRPPLLSAMHAAGKLFPRSDRSPAIEPVRPATMAGLVAAHPSLGRGRLGRSHRVQNGFYISQAMEVLTGP